MTARGIAAAQAWRPRRLSRDGARQPRAVRAGDLPDRARQRLARPVSAPREACAGRPRARARPARGAPCARVPAPPPTGRRRRATACASPRGSSPSCTTRSCDSATASAISEIPALYIADQANGISEAFAAWHHQFIVIRPVYFIVPLEEVRPIYEFEIGRELGRIRLGHTRWWEELLVAYVVKLPLLRNCCTPAPTRTTDAAARPDSVRGLTGRSGRRHAPHARTYCVRPLRRRSRARFGAGLSSAASGRQLLSSSTCRSSSPSAPCRRAPVWPRLATAERGSDA